MFRCSQSESLEYSLIIVAPTCPLVIAYSNIRVVCGEQVIKVSTEQ